MDVSIGSSNGQSLEADMILNDEEKNRVTNLTVPTNCTTVCNNKSTNGM